MRINTIFFQDDDIHIRHAKALMKVNQGLINKVRENSYEGLFMIDNIQRLAIEYYFEEEIEAAVRKQHMMLGNQSHRGNYDLELVALQFRLLRQEGCFVHEGELVALQFRLLLHFISVLLGLCYYVHFISNY